MPKIIIREIDNTTAGLTEYSNFSVVVPGVIGTPEEQKEVFDDNGVYECKRQSDFVKYIGKKAKITGGSCATYIVPEHTITAAEFNGVYKNRVYSFSIITDPAEKKPGKLKVHNDLGWFLLAKVETYVAADAPQYTIIGNEGSDSIEQLGNQIAYELLGLGYTVLFKKITNAEAVGAELEDPAFWECLKDKSLYDFRFVCTGGFRSVTAYKHICELASHDKAETIDNDISTGRGDCVALIDVDETNVSKTSPVAGIRAYVNSLVNTDNTTFLTKYSAVFAPTVTYAGKKDAVYDNLTFPASFHYLACAGYSKGELGFAEWYAAAGYTRGVCGKTVESLTLKLGEIAVNALQPRIEKDGTKHAVNLITSVRGGTYLWGNRTALALSKATDENPGLIAGHFLNIRQLCSTIKKDVYVACRQLTFDPNSDLLWGNFCNAIKPTLEKMKADQGIGDYKITKVKSTEKALLTAKIRIVPIEAVEDFDISIYLEDSISGVSVEADEE